MTNRDKLTTTLHHHEAIEDEIQDEIFPVLIFDASYLGEKVPEGFNAVRIAIDGKTKADLSWKEEQAVAESYVKQGLRIFWEMDLGLPSSLPHSLSNRTQFLSLALSLEHFKETLWKRFRKETMGLCLYRGLLDFSLDYPWDDEQTLNFQEWIREVSENSEVFFKQTSSEISDIFQLTHSKMRESLVGKDLLRFFSCNAIGEYLNLLAARVPDPVPLFLLFDDSGIEDPFTLAQLLSRERYGRFHIAVKKSGMDREDQILGGEISWEGIPTEKGGICRMIKNRERIERVRLGFCLPEKTLCHFANQVNLKNALNSLLIRNLSFRIISEADLSNEWDGLDYLIVDPQFVEISFKRKLKGFCAAGGTVILIGNQSLGLPEEISFDVF